jgi:exopolyphosphatase/pppGpp-phosphohydrolase
VKKGHSNMEKEFYKIHETINRLYALQTGHLEAFKKKPIPDLEKQSAERGDEVVRLVKSVNKFVKMARNKQGVATESMLLSLNNKITTLLEQNKALETKVKDFRDRIKKNMKQVSKGKQVIGSYRSSNLVSNNPRVISVTN